MKIMKKLVIASGLILHFAGSIYASSYNMSNWANAFLAFGGGSNAAAAAQNVLNNKGAMSYSNAYSSAQSVGTPEAWAVGAFMASSKQNLLKSIYQSSDVIAAGNALIGSAGTPSAPIKVLPTPSAPPMPTPSAPAMPTASAMQQQQADVAAATANNQALSAIANSGQQGAALYNAYADYIFNLLEQAVTAIADAPTQRVVIQHIQSNAANLSASSARSNSYNSRTLGRMNSKK
ncbi:MAG: hypothetical protein JO129_00225, partial [Candidatus Dependentiae bacterium]|nr:hypothetical protein [Candidatus Dependentiae bacterium]